MFVPNMFTAVNIQRLTHKIHSETNIGLHVKYPMLCSDLEPNWNVQIYFRKLNTTSHKNPLNVSPLFMLKDGNTNMAKLRREIFNPFVSNASE
jgi:hypothetical protein